MHELWQLDYSPWSQKARWALDHHGIRYEAREHVPMLGELSLRRAAGGLGKKASVPLLRLDDGTAIGDSFDIARWADRHSQNGAPSLFPRGKEASVIEINARADKALRAGRVLVMRRTVRDPEARREAVPAAIPGFLHPMMAATVPLATRFLAGKHDAETARPEGDLQQDIRDELTWLRMALDGKPYLLGELTFADIAMATMIHVVRPREGLRPGTARAWTNEPLWAEFPDLVAWRDDLWKKHR